jgi:hypothetical protein
MEIQKTQAISGVSANANKPPQDFSKLQAGAMLNAVVSGITGDNTYILKLLDGRLIRAQTLNELALGQVLKLEVVKAGAVPELKIAGVPPEHAGQPAALAVQNALRQLLPKQVELKDLTALLKQAAGIAQGKSEPVSAAIQSTLAALPAKTDLMTAEGVKQGIANSGVFLEAKLARQISPHGDIKGQLLVLAEALQKNPPTKADDAAVFKSLADDGPTTSNPALLAKTEGAIARITLDQLASLPHNEESQNSWQISLPFTNGQHTESLNLKIKREPSRNPAQQQAGWSVVLELNPPGMAPLHCKVSLHADKVDTYFWSDSEPNLQQVQEHLGLLAQRYAEAGLTTGHLNVVDAARMRAETAEKTHLPTLLDDFA